VPARKSADTPTPFNCAVEMKSKRGSSAEYWKNEMDASLRATKSLRDGDTAIAVILNLHFAVRSQTVVSSCR
jgi:hypothetical protein